MLDVSSFSIKSLFVVVLMNGIRLHENSRIVGLMINSSQGFNWLCRKGLDLIVADTSKGINSSLTLVC